MVKISWQEELAKKLKGIGNKKTSSSIIGEVLSASPLKVSIYGGEVILNEKMIYRCKLLTEGNRIASGDMVLCLPLDDYSSFVIIDKVVR